MFYSPLFDSSLIVFRAPLKHRLKEPYTASTFHRLERITALARYTRGIDIVCTPNIWAQKDDSYIPRNAKTVKDAEDDIAQSTFGSDSTQSSFSLPSLKMIEDSPIDFNYWDSPKTPRTPRASKAPVSSGVKKFRSHKGNFEVGENARFFVIKSYSNLDVQASIQNGIWASTDLGNKRLDKAYREANGEIYLLFSVNGSAKFCGISKMKSPIDFSQASDIWVESSRWKGIFPVEWLIVKEIPNRVLRHLRVISNENKPVANSRDTQELPHDIGLAMLTMFDTHVN